MFFNIILLFIIAITVVFLYSKPFYEGFFNVPVSDHIKLTKDSATKFGKMTSMFNLTDAAIDINPVSADKVKQALNGINTTPGPNGQILSQPNEIKIPNDIPSGLRQASYCQKAPNTCAAFDNPQFVSNNCGMSFDIDGTDSGGKPHVGGLYVSPDNREQQLQMAQNVEETGGPPYDPYKVYQPTLGTAKPGTFGITKDSCIVVKEKVDCSTKQSFNSPNCTQCYTSQNFNRVDPKTGRLPATLHLFGNGIGHVIAGKDFDPRSGIAREELNTNNGVTVSLELIREGTQFLILLYKEKTIVPPLYLSGYIEGPTARGTFKLDIRNLVQSDAQTGTKPRITGTKNFNGFRCSTMVPGKGKDMVSLVCLMPFSFIDMYDGDALACDNGPIITKAESAAFLESDPCFGKANQPGNYKLECLQARWTALGGTPEGEGYPSTQAKADALQKPNGQTLDIDTIVDNLSDTMRKALTGKNSAGQMLSIPEWNSASMYATGIPINSPCDGPGGDAPISQACAAYLYSNQGIGSHVGSTYTLPASQVASGLGLKEGFENKEDFINTNTYNYPGAPMDPMTPSGEKAVENAGSIAEIKQKYDAVNRLANDNSKKNSERADAVRQAYGINLKPSTSNKNDFDVRISAGQPTKSYADMKQFCESKGQRLCDSSEICDMSSRIVINPELTSEFPGDNWIAVGDADNEWLTLNRGGDRYCKTHTEVANMLPEWGTKRDPSGWERLAKCCGGGSMIQGRFIRFQYNRVDCLNLAQVQVFTSQDDSTGIITPNTSVSRSSAGYWGGIFPERNFVNGSGNTFVHSSCGDVPWVMVDLGAMTPIYKVVLTNRKDCCLERIVGTTMIILNGQMKPVYNSAPIISVNQTYTYFPPSTGVYPDMNGDKPTPGYTHAGCWRDTGDRAVPQVDGSDSRINDSYWGRHDAINKCYQVAKDRGMKVFAVQHNGWCAAAPDESGYKKYGKSDQCYGAGKGGPWANDVYIIKDENTTTPAEKKNIYGNNGSTTCERYCSGVGGGAWNNELPDEWNGAACAGVGPGIKDCYSTFSFQPGVSTCVCKKTGTGWRQGGWLNQ
jgi:hypothetical protein